MIPARSTYRTYSHLLGLGRMPTEYEIVSCRVLYSAGRAPEVRTPVVGWYEKYGADQQLRCADWEAFRDPRETTYAKYTEMQSQKERFADGILHSMEEAGALGGFASFLSAARFACHGLQMSAAYVGQLAPSGRIAMASLFQCADELRRVHRFAQVLALWRRTSPREVDAGRDLWQSHPDWQPLRRLLEQHLATYAWGESFVSLNLCLKPELDSLFAESLVAAAGDAGDPLLRELLKSLGEDVAWHRTWTAELEKFMCGADPANQERIADWRAKWSEPANAAAEPLRRLVGASRGTGEIRGAS